MASPALPIPIIAEPKTLKPAAAFCSMLAMEIPLTKVITALPAFSKLTAMALAPTITACFACVIAAITLFLKPIIAVFVDDKPPTIPFFILCPICAHVIALNWL